MRGTRLPARSRQVPHRMFRPPLGHLPLPNTLPQVAHGPSVDNCHPPKDRQSSAAVGAHRTSEARPVGITRDCRSPSAESVARPPLHALRDVKPMTRRLPCRARLARRYRIHRAHERWLRPQPPTGAHTAPTLRTKAGADPMRVGSPGARRALPAPPWRRRRGPRLTRRDSIVLTSSRPPGDGYGYLAAQGRVAPGGSVPGGGTTVRIGSIARWSGRFLSSMNATTNAVP